MISCLHAHTIDRRLACVTNKLSLYCASLNNAPDFQEKTALLDKSKTYLVHCASGGRSARACEKLGSLDFPKVYNLPAGFKAWVKAGKPVEK
jgi:rhodanese-related sulfurtransferase